MAGGLGGLFEIRQVVAILIHCFEDFEDGVDGQSCDIEQQQWPEDVDLQHLEITADGTESKCEGGPGPYALFAKSSRQGLVLASVAVDLDEVALGARTQI